MSGSFRLARGSRVHSKLFLLPKEFDFPMKYIGRIGSHSSSKEEVFCILFSNSCSESLTGYLKITDVDSGSFAAVFRNYQFFNKSLSKCYS